MLVGIDVGFAVGAGDCIDVATLVDDVVGAREGAEVGIFVGSAAVGGAADV